MTDIDELKISFDGEPKYLLSNAKIYKSEKGFTFSKYLDCLSESSSTIIDENELNELNHYLQNQLQHNSIRFDNQINLVMCYTKNTNGFLLDVGCGGGAFLQKAKAFGFDIKGVELEPNRAEYSRKYCGCEILEVDICEPSFIIKNENNFSVVTLWDVIEHVNFPMNTLKAVFIILQSGGHLFIDTPAKDAFYHRFGELTYAITGGRYPTFLNIMYSEHPFGHKQIFSTKELVSILQSIGFEMCFINKVHELSFPHEYYLKKLFKSDSFARKLVPFVNLFFALFRMKNKMVIVARKP